MYPHLQAERENQQQWERQLCEREKRLKQQEEAVGRQADLEEIIHSRILAVNEVRQTAFSLFQYNIADTPCYICCVQVTVTDCKS